MAGKRTGPTTRRQKTPHIGHARTPSTPSTKPPPSAPTMGNTDTCPRLASPCVSTFSRKPRLGIVHHRGRANVALGDMGIGRRKRLLPAKLGLLDSSQERWRPCIADFGRALNNGILRRLPTM
ncbi:hypothetical protein LX36DRAFT_650988 [Colletotrichum falcatum]|nr:hypothetical protein LX36DRAFT_650988 [Colletotrichum falcatum]